MRKGGAPPVIILKDTTYVRYLSAIKKKEKKNPWISRANEVSVREARFDAKAKKGPGAPWRVKLP